MDDCRNLAHSIPVSGENHVSGIEKYGEKIGGLTTERNAAATYLALLAGFGSVT